MIKLLFVEDDVSLNKVVTAYLSKRNFHVVNCLDAKTAIDYLENESFDIILSDIMMKDIDGFTFRKYVLEIKKDIPFIFMSAREDMISKKIGYDLEIDDYLVKPFDLDELILKINAILKRAKITKSKVIEVGNLIMNEDERTVLINNEEVNFTLKEFNILFKMLSYPKRTFTRSQIFDEFWGFDSSSTSRSVDVCILKIREKTKDADGFEIVTKHGLGYKIVLKETE